MIKYLITDPRYYTTNPQSFKDALNRSLIKYTPNFVCFRDKTSGDKSELLEAFSDTASKHDFISFVNGSLESALRYELDGVHLRGDQFGEIESVKAEGLFCIASCHSTDEISKALHLGCDYVTLSPVFDTPGKGDPIGLHSFDLSISAVEKSKVIALGGIDSDEKARLIASTGVCGFASIRYFVR